MSCRVLILKSVRKVELVLLNPVEPANSGGTGDFAAAVAVDASDQAYVTGATQNSAFPTTTGVFQKTCSSCAASLDDAFVTVYNAAGSAYVYSTFLGGSNADQGFGIALDSSKNAYITGATSSTDFPKQSAVQGTLGGGFDAFVAELNSTGSALVYSTYLGGAGNDYGIGIAVDSSGKAYVTGGTASTDFPVQGATQVANGGGDDAFVSEFSAGGSSLAFSTYLGGSGSEDITGGGTLGGIAVDTAGANFYVTGITSSTNFPVTSGVRQGTFGGGTADAFIAKYSSAGAPASFSVANGALSATSGAPGVSATSTITVTSAGGFNSAVTLSCAVTPAVSEGPTCAFSNPGASVTPPANGNVTATLTVNTTPASAASNRTAGRSSGWLYAMFLPIGGLALLGSASSRRKRVFGFLLLGLLLAGLLVMPACGGGSSSGGGGGGGGNAGTPANTYTITITGTSGGTAVTGSPALTLAVN